MASKNRITVNLGDNEYRELQAIAKKHRISIAWLGRHAIMHMLEQYKPDEFQLPLGLAEPARRAS